MDGNKLLPLILMCQLVSLVVKREGGWDIW